MRTHTCASTCSPDVNLRHLSQHLPILLGWLTCKPPKSTCLCFLSTGIIVMNPHAQLCVFVCTCNSVCMGGGRQLSELALSFLHVSPED